MADCSEGEWKPPLSDLSELSNGAAEIRLFAKHSWDSPVAFVTTQSSWIAAGSRRRNPGAEVVRFATDEGLMNFSASPSARVFPVPTALLRTWTILQHYGSRHWRFKLWSLWTRKFDEFPCDGQKKWESKVD